jgi:hypothetical protein
MKLDAQRKQFDLIIKQNSTLLAATVKRNGGSNSVSGGGSSGGGGGGGHVGGGDGNKHHDQATKAIAQTATNWLSMRRPIASRSQQTRTRFQPGTSPSNQIDRDKGPLIVLT